MAEASKYLEGKYERNYSEAELWHSFQQGDNAAFEHIYRTYVNDLFNYGIKVVRNHDMVKDCIQDLFLELWKSRQRLAKVKSIKFYLIKALRWKIIHYKKEQDSVHFISPYETTAGNLVQDSHEQKLIGEENVQANSLSLNSAFRKLPCRQQEVLNLLYYEKLSYEEVSSVMGINVKSVYTLVWKAFGTLKKSLV